MAIAKLTFTKIRAGAKASLRYYVHRYEEKGERITRTIFDRDGKVSKYYASRMIDKAPKGTTFFRLIISPDRKTEDLGRRLNMREVTDQTMRDLKRILGTKEAIEYLGIEHTNTKNRHVHAMFFVQGRIGREALAELRKSATAASRTEDGERQQRKPEHQVDRPHGRKPWILYRSGGLSVSRTGRIWVNPIYLKQKEQTPEQTRVNEEQKTRPASRTRGNAKAERLCPNCRGSILVPRGRFLQCANCGMAVNRRRGLSFDAPKQRGRELSLFKTYDR